VKLRPVVIAKLRERNAEKEVHSLGHTCCSHVCQKTLFEEFSRDVWPTHAANVQRLLVEHGGDYLTGSQVRSMKENAECTAHVAGDMV
jgi:hypothetical protein